MRELTDKERAAILKEMREDEAAAKREDAHWYGRQSPAASGDGMAALKRDDPAVNELVAEIESVVSRRYVENPEPICGPMYMKGEGGLRFEQLYRGDRLDLLVDGVFWNHYADQGISEAQQLVILGNVVDGKPKEWWLDGAFEQDIGQAALRNILRGNYPKEKTEPAKTQDRGGRDI